MLNILITGANGQLGRSLQRLGGVSPHNYICTDVAELDITDAGAVLRAVREHRIDVIVNCAAYTDVEKAEEAGCDTDPRLDGLRLRRHSPYALYRGCNAFAAGGVRPYETCG